ncbi:hypothetical protein [Lysinibacter sp. HNR]|uniref:hypothetical protein n=1 Tax=Lysinibacter sp. HNR TaxID=3031408 RepID=UPI002434AA2C|nr:hypothetical protein [Lysinibacter sp. HNR]WGD37570.1 hypothetical protein FrondiHNR_01200 [Lysinibacter sp. HNR]
MARNIDKTRARSRARERRLALDAERIERETKIDDALTGFFLAEEELLGLEAERLGIVAQQRKIILDLSVLGESDARIADLLEISRVELRRLKKVDESLSEEESSVSAPVHTMDTDSGAASFPISSAAYEGDGGTV